MHITGLESLSEDCTEMHVIFSVTSDFLLHIH